MLHNRYNLIYYNFSILSAFILHVQSMFLTKISKTEKIEDIFFIKLNITYNQKYLRVSFKYENCDSINLFLK